ncbi:MAG: hypothetical protein HPKKFMNG_01272 [Planctomycetes bacterium]|nr:hypothetical protein [Planctomycetota bacterium]HRJ77189.1 DUF542 domain-containing protein [Planctomycetota bacterium]
MATVITPETMIPEAIKAHPQLRGVLDQYGLKGCGGEFGPAESMEFFAKTHGVDSARLLNELNAAVANPRLAPAVDYKPSLADSIYRRFFLGAIGVTFTAGALWGVILLWQIAFAGKFTALPINEINAHGHSQIYGWVGLIIMGYAYQAFPRFKHGALWRPSLAAFSFVLMLMGIALRVVGEYFAVSIHQGTILLSPLWFGLGMLGSCLELMAALLFVLVMAMTYRTIGKPLETYDKWVFAAVGWFVLGIIGDAFLYYATATAPDRGALVSAVAAYQLPLRQVQLYGLATMMILGVSLRFMPPVFGFADPGEKLYRRMFWPLILGVAASSTLFVVMFKTGEFLRVGMAYYAATLLIVVPSLWISLSFRPFGKVTGNDRSIKFIRASHFWFMLSMVMLALEPWYNRLTGQTFSHAYHGAMMHALTVGFISMSILGVGAKVVANLCGEDTARLSRLWLVFLLINAGTALRVGNQVLTDFAPASFNLLGISGLLILAALVLWAQHILVIMYRPRQAAHAMNIESVTIAPQARVGLVLQRWPHTLDVFVKHGFGLLKNPVFRNTLARNVTLQQACEFQKVDLLRLMDDLNEATRERGSAPAPAHSCASLDPGLTVAEAARRYPVTVPVFSELHLDACCGGADTIANAVEHHGLKLEEVMLRLNQAIAKAHS